MECSPTMFWLHLMSRQAGNQCRLAWFGGFEHPSGSNISPLRLLPLLKMEREPNLVSTSYINMIECSFTMFWLNFMSQQAGYQCKHAWFGGSEHPFGLNTSPLCMLLLLKMKREPNIVSTLYIDMMECSGTMLWLDFTSRQATNRCRHACFGGSDHPFGSNISPLCVLPLLKMKREPNLVSILYIDMTEGSLTTFWLNFRSGQAVNRCYRDYFGGLWAPFWIKYHSIVRVAIVENEMRAQHKLYTIYRHDWRKFDHVLSQFQVTKSCQ